nr:aspartate/glutamate racemase family protein [candidate division Zixibacteria bacterium]
MKISFSRILQFLFIMPLILFGLSCSHGNKVHDNLQDRLAKFHQKDKVTIILTDSGLGGLSVAADIEHRLRDYGLFGEVSMVYFNALPDESRPYNGMSSTAEKVITFNSALNSMATNYHPDLILIACNTLSVIYAQTEFSRQMEIPVVDIVKFGVDLIYDKLKNDSGGVAVILGTPTTIGQDTHRRLLIARGIDSTKILTQGCDMLESEIQVDPKSDMVSAMIEMYASEVLESISRTDRNRLYVGLCCTHYGYTREIFQQVFERTWGGTVEALDPNSIMSGFLFDDKYNNRHDNTAITVTVVSQARLNQDEIASIGVMIRPVSPATAEALINYVYNPNLFKF